MWSKLQEKKVRTIQDILSKKAGKEISSLSVGLNIFCLFEARAWENDQSPEFWSYLTKKHELAGAFGPEKPAPARTFLFVKFWTFYQKLSIIEYHRKLEL